MNLLVPKKEKSNLHVYLKDTASHIVLLIVWTSVHSLSHQIVRSITIAKQSVIVKHIQTVRINNPSSIKLPIIALGHSLPAWSLWEREKQLLWSSRVNSATTAPFTYNFSSVPTMLMRTNKNAKKNQLWVGSYEVELTRWSSAVSFDGTLNIDTTYSIH